MKNQMRSTMAIIDIHNHVLPEVDDGPKTWEESIELVNALQSLGITSLVLSSHYIEDSKYNKTVAEREKILTKLQEKVKDIDFYLGNEVYMASNILELKKKKRITTINNSKYMLIEFPRFILSQEMFLNLSFLVKKGIIPIIAHPERYSFIKEDLSIIEELKSYGCLFQGNVGSIVNMYGKGAKKIFKYMLKNNYYTFLATDIHDVKYIPLMEKSYKKITKLIGEKTFKKLTYSNPLKVINDEEIS